MLQQRGGTRADRWPTMPLYAGVSQGLRPVRALLAASSLLELWACRHAQQHQPGGHREHDRAATVRPDSSRGPRGLPASIRWAGLIVPKQASAGVDHSRPTGTPLSWRQERRSCSPILGRSQGRLNSSPTRHDRRRIENAATTIHADAKRTDRRGRPTPRVNPRITDVGSTAPVATVCST